MQADEQATAAASDQSLTQPDTAPKADAPAAQAPAPKVPEPQANPAAIELTAIIERWVASVPVALIQELEAFCKKHHAPLA